MASIMKGNESKGINYLQNRNRKIYNEKPRQRHMNKKQDQDRNLTQDVSFENERCDTLDKPCSNKVAGNNQVNVTVSADDEPSQDDSSKKKDDTSFKSLQLLL